LHKLFAQHVVGYHEKRTVASRPASDGKLKSRPRARRRILLRKISYGNTILATEDITTRTTQRRAQRCRRAFAPSVRRHAVPTKPDVRSDCSPSRRPCSTIPTTDRSVRRHRTVRRHPRKYPPSSMQTSAVIYTNIRRHPHKCPPSFMQMSAVIHPKSAVIHANVRRHPCKCPPSSTQMSAVIHANVRRHASMIRCIYTASAGI
jgi:hypothetical protein